MRLRRETGDFQIVAAIDADSGEITANSIRPGLSAEDLIGEVAVMANEMMVITEVKQIDDETVEFGIGTGLAKKSVRYHKTSGEITESGI